jgi:IS605 OrfB family transposase
MFLTTKVKLVPTEAQNASLVAFMEKFNDACNWVSQQAFDAGVFHTYKLQSMVYRELREHFGFSSAVAVRVVAKVGDAYKISKRSVCVFKKHGAIPYSTSSLSWRMRRGEVSIQAGGRREHIPFCCGKQAEQMLQTRRPSGWLVLIEGVFYFHVFCSVDVPDVRAVESFLGVDLGIVNIAVDSEGHVYSGQELRSIRSRYARLRSKLQSKGTRSARRRLKKLRCKESRFISSVNHGVSKAIVAFAEGTEKGVALEELTGIRSRITARKAKQKFVQASWSFAQLREFISYKAALAGVCLVVVDPRNTSRQCPMCESVDKRNRKTQSQFLCVDCGFSAPADLNAARNIARRAVAEQPYAVAA